MNKKSKDINKQVEFGLDSIDANDTVEISLKDFMLIYKMLEEFNRFFHQKSHFKTMEDLEHFLGDRDSGAYSIIHNLYYKVVDKYIPEDLHEKINDDHFTCPDKPFYYNIKNDETIDDTTLNVVDRKLFSEFVNDLLSDYSYDSEAWENRDLDRFLEAIASYSEDIDGYYKNMKFETSPDTPTWRIFAQILKGASVYE